MGNLWGQPDYKMIKRYPTHPFTFISMLSIQHYEFAASCASTDAYISLEHKVGHPRVGNMPWGESVKLLGTIQRSPVGPG